MLKPIPYVPVTMADAKRVHDGSPRAPGPDWTKRRAAVDNTEALLPATAAWIATLPLAAQPHNLAERYPRIANRLCTLWRQPDRCDAYFADLLLAKRNNRRGFPVDVAQDLTRLAAHFATLYADDRRWNATH